MIEPMKEILEQETTEISTEKCLDLLRSASIARIATTERALPTIVPVRIVVNRTEIVIAPIGIGRNELRVGTVVALAADQLSEDYLSGWAVEVCGTLRSSHLVPPSDDRRQSGALHLSTEHIRGWHRQ
jgi:hypothetical protein